MVELELTRVNRIAIARAFAFVQRVDLGIPCVIEGQMGRAFGDRVDRPTAYRIEVGPFCYFAGESGGEGGRDALLTMPQFAFVMPSAPGWHDRAIAALGDKLIPMERYSYAGDSITAAALPAVVPDAARDYRIRRIDERLAEDAWRSGRFIDLSTYASPSDFVSRGIGFAADDGSGEPFAAAYASLVCSEGIEVSVFVEPHWRRRGVATALSAELLRWCLARGLRANWDAANRESCALAEKLGYRRSGTYRAFVYSA